MRLVSFSNSYFSISISNYQSVFSISRVKSCSSDGSPYLPDASYFDESTTFAGVVSFVCTCCTPCCTCCCCASLSCLRSSCSFKSCSFNSCNSFSVSSILLLSLYLCTILLLHCCLFTSIAVAAFSTSGYARNLQLWSSSMQSIIFLLPLSCTSMLASVVGAGALRDPSSCYFTNHSTVKLTCSLCLEKLEQYLHVFSSPQ